MLSTSNPIVPRLEAFRQHRLAVRHRELDVDRLAIEGRAIANEHVGATFIGVFDFGSGLSVCYSVEIGRNERHETEAVVAHVYADGRMPRIAYRPSGPSVGRRVNDALPLIEALRVAVEGVGRG